MSTAPPLRPVLATTWHEPERPTALSSVLSELEDHLATYIATRVPTGITVIALWIAHCHAMGAWYATPRLLITSPLPGSGKTTVLDHVAALTHDAILGSNATPALLARITRTGPRPILLDEADNLLDRKREGLGDLLAVLNSGYKKNGSRPVLVAKKDGSFEVENMPTYAAVAFAGIGDNLPDATRSRTIAISLDRAPRGAVRESDWQMIEPAADMLRDRITSVIKPITASLSAVRPELEVHGRDAEIWRPLAAIADMAGGDWPAKVRTALRESVAEARADRAAGVARDRPSLVLLRDLAEIWPDREALVRTDTLIDLLAHHNTDTWGTEARFGVVKAKRIAMLLHDYGIRPERSADRTFRGYLLHDLERAWSRYLTADVSEASDPSQPSVLSTTGSTGTTTSDTSDTSDASPETPWGLA